MPKEISNHNTTSNKRDTRMTQPTITPQTGKQQTEKQQNNNQPSILNVAEMILHGVADTEILDIWLRSISCQEFVANFVDAGYDMPTLSRITPQDLTAIGVTDPTKRLKILSEIKKLNLQDGLPTFKPANLSHWLSLIRLDKQYYQPLCDQKIDSIEKCCQLTWEDFEELGITKLGHQKRLLLAIERMKQIESESKNPAKTLSEPIYDSNPSQILLMASAENHSMNGPIINKQSSTSELISVSSTGSGSMHSVYSSSSAQYQPTYASVPHNSDLNSATGSRPTMIPNTTAHGQNFQQQHYQQSQPAIYSQPTQIFHPSHTQVAQPMAPPSLPTPQHFDQASHYQAVQQMTASIRPQPQANSSLTNGVINNEARDSTNVPPLDNRQSMGQFPFAALANLQKQQQHIMQQSSIYATLSRQPQRPKPPPVPIRTNSLKTNSLTDEPIDEQHFARRNSTNEPFGRNTSTLMRSGNRIARNQFKSQTLLTKNKSFNGNALMEAARARFINRNSQPHFLKMGQQAHQIDDYNNSIYGVHSSVNVNTKRTNGFSCERDNFNLRNHHPVATVATNLMQPNGIHINHCSMSPHQTSQPQRFSTTAFNANGNLIGSTNPLTGQGDGCDPHSDTTSTKSLILPPTNMVNSLVESNCQTMSNSQDSGSSQTLYNSASSGSNDQNLSALTADNLRSQRSTTSSSTLNDANLTLEQQSHFNNHRMNGSALLNSIKTNSTGKGVVIQGGQAQCNATTGKDDDFPPPPSPLSLTDSDEHDLVATNSDLNFNDISRGLMTFRIGT